VLSKAYNTGVKNLSYRPVLPPLELHLDARLLLGQTVGIVGYRDPGDDQPVLLGSTIKIRVPGEDSFDSLVPVVFSDPGFQNGAPLVYNLCTRF